MQTANKLRAELVFEEYTTDDCVTVVTDNIKRYLAESPSIIESGICSRKGCSSKKPIMKFPVVVLNKAVFNNDFKNLKAAIEANFPDENRCQKCCQLVEKFERKVGNHLFIEVCGDVSKSL